MPGQAALADETSGPKRPDDPLLALIGDHAEVDLTLQYVEHGIALGALSEDISLGFVGRDVRPSPAVARKTSGSNRPVRVFGDFRLSLTGMLSPAKFPNCRMAASLGRDCSTLNSPL